MNILQSPKEYAKELTRKGWKLEDMNVIARELKRYGMTDEYINEVQSYLE